MFSITQGKGVRITFENGWSLSVQWGEFNYCDNHDNSIDTIDRFRTNVRVCDNILGLIP